jgi:hypothetical protein
LLQITFSPFQLELQPWTTSLLAVAVVAPAVAVAVAVYCRSLAIRFHLVQHFQSGSVLAVLAAKVVYAELAPAHCLAANQS